MSYIELDSIASIFLKRYYNDTNDTILSYTVI
jgi:hypothetical protein